MLKLLSISFSVICPLHTRTLLQLLQWAGDVVGEYPVLPPFPSAHAVWRDYGQGSVYLQPTCVVWQQVGLLVSSLGCSMKWIQMGL